MAMQSKRIFVCSLFLFIFSSLFHCTTCVRFFFVCLLIFTFFFQIFGNISFFLLSSLLHLIPSSSLLLDPLSFRVSLSSRRHWSVFPCVHFVRPSSQLDTCTYHFSPSFFLSLSRPVCLVITARAKSVSLFFFFLSLSFFMVLPFPACRGDDRGIRVGRTIKKSCKTTSKRDM